MPTQHRYTETGVKQFYDPDGENPPAEETRVLTFPRQAPSTLYYALLWQQQAAEILRVRGWCTPTTPAFTASELRQMDAAYSAGQSPEAFVDAVIAARSAQVAS